MKQTTTITNALNADEAAFFAGLKNRHAGTATDANSALMRQNSLNIVMGMSAAVALTEDTPDETTPSEGEDSGTSK